jgi:hypothetical protein
MTYTRPGIYVSEGPFTTHIATSPSTSAAAFVGTAERGPSSPALIQSWNSYKTQFGDLDVNYEMGYALYHFFANGGRTAYVSRVTSGASSSIAALVNIQGTVASAPGTVFKLSAPSVGTWGNAISATITAGLVSGNTPTFNLVISYDGVPVETWSELSLDANNARYAPTVVNNYSAYVIMSNVGVTTAGTTYTVTPVVAPLATGANGTTIVASDWSTALTKLDGVEGQLVINLVGQSNTTIVNNAIDYVTFTDSESTPNARKNSFLIVDPNPELTVASDIVTAVSGYTVSSYVAVYYGMLSMTNPAVRGSAALRNTYPCGAIAGLYQRVDAERGVGRAAAGYGYTLQNTFGTVTNFTEAQVGTLYAAHINTLKNVAGAGVIVNGARTLKKTDITKYIPSRRTLNYVKAQVEDLTKPALFQPIGDRLWSSLEGSIAKMLSGLWSSGALKGRSAAEAFYVTCDATNNPPYVVEAGEVHIEVGVALASPAEFIVINVSQFTGGNTVTETL